MDEEDDFRRMSLQNYQIARVAQEVSDLGVLLASIIPDFSGKRKVPEPRPLGDFLVKVEDRTPKPEEKPVARMTPEEIREKKERATARSRGVWRAAIEAARRLVR